MSDTGFLSWLFGELEDLVTPLIDAFSSKGQLTAFLRDFGWLTPNQFDLGSVQTLVQNTSNDVTQVIQLVDESVDDPSTILANAGTIATTLSGLVSDVQGLANLVANPPTASDLPYAFTQPQFWQDFADQIVQELVIRYLQSHQGQVYSALKALGVIEEKLVHVPADPNRVNFRKRYFHWDNLLNALSQPKQVLQKLFNWGPGSPLDFATMTEILQETLIGIGLLAYLRTPDPSALTSYYSASNPALANLQELRIPIAGGVDATGTPFSCELSIIPIPDDGINMGPPTGLVISPVFTGTIPSGVSFITLTGSFQAGQGLTIEIHPNQPIKLNLTGDAGLELALVPSGPVVLLGSAQTDPSNPVTGIQISELNFGLGLSSPFDDPDVAVYANFGDVTASIVTSDGDSFLSTVLPNPITTTISDFGVRWSSKNGLSFKGGISLDLTFQIHQELGPISLDTIEVALAADSSSLVLALGVSGGVTLGPVQAAVDNVGLNLIVEPNLAPAGPSGANLPVSLGFKPPDGLGLSIDAGPVTGGGYIQFDPNKGEYAGILQVGVDIPVVSIEITIIGVLDTKLPGGVSGYSFLLIVSTDFTPIQLGFGFTLNGVGGLAGINRSMSLDALRAGVKNHTLDDVLFPADPIIPKAPQIISEVSTIFPITVGSYVFGIMLDLGWGEPQIIDAELGIILELPNPVNIALIGEFTAGLPSVEDTDIALVLIQIDILGIIDFADQQFTLTGTLFDSHVVEFQLSGGMLMFLDWSPKPQFILSIGGVGPGIPAPPGIKWPPPLVIGIGSGSVNMSLTAYFTVTSNWVDFGADLELNASAAGFSLNGHLTFYAFFQWNPFFRFTIGMTAGISIMHGGSTLFSLQLAFTLSGPKPWHAQGSVSFTILFITVSIGVNVTIGDPADSQPAQQVAVLPLLQAALQSASAWSAQLPEAVGPLVTIAAAPSGDQTLYVHPMGELTVHQKVVPLDTSIDLFGSAVPSDGSSYSISGITVDSLPQTVPPDTDIQDFFARGQFQTLSDSDKLSEPSFENMPSGTHVGSTDFQTTNVISQNSIPNQQLDLALDTYYIETPIQPATLVKDNYHPSFNALAAAIGLGASNSPARSMGNGKYVSPGVAPVVTTQPQLYTIVNAQTLAPVTGLAPSSGSTLTAAEGTLQTHFAAHPEDMGQVQIVPIQEAQVT